jgi:hypothetical protein
MKIEIAKKIVSEILEWQFIMMGVKERNSFKSVIDLNEYSLKQLLEANDIVSEVNEITMKESKGSHTIHMTCADRLISAVYTALNFEPDGEAVVLINDRMVGVVKAKY